MTAESPDSLAHPGGRQPIRVVLAATPGMDAMDLTATLELLSYAGQVLGERGAATGCGYDVDVVSTTAPGPIMSWRGLDVVAHRSYRELDGAIDTLIVTPTPLDGDLRLLERYAFLGWLREHAPHVRRLVSFCTASFVLAAAGLLDGRRATTHWAVADEMRKRFPNVSVDADAVYVRDGALYTSAGALAALDLTLALIEEDFGPEVARRVAQYMVLYLRRPGGQSQFSAQLACQFAESEPLRALQAWIHDHVAEDLSIDALADRVAMSPRNFRRVFAKELGMTPARYVERVRVEAARRRLEESRNGVDQIAAECGFGSPETMRCAFVRALGISPKEYRERFATAQRPRR